MSWPCECLSFLKNPLVVRYQHRSAPVVLHTSTPVMLKLFTCAVGHLSWSSSLRLYRCHLSFSYWIQPCSLHTSPETELCRMKQPPQIIKQTASCLLLLMQFGFRRRRMDHKLKPSTSLGTQRSRNIFFVFCCFVFFSGLDRLTLRVLLGSIGVALSPSMLSHDNGASQCLL